MSHAQKIKLKQTKKNVKKYLHLLIKDGFPIKEAYIFGSYAREDFHDDSDIDVCIVSSRFKKKLGQI